MFNERTAIEIRLREIAEEGRQLREERKDLIERLRTIDDRDYKAEDIGGLTSELEKSVQTVKNLVPDVTVEQVIEYMRGQSRAHTGSDLPVETKDTENEITSSQSFKTAVDDAKAYERSKQPRPTKKQGTHIPKAGPNRTRIIGGIMKGILRESGRPVKAGVIREELRTKHGVDYSTNSLSTMLKRLKDNEAWIDSPHHGTYQFIHGTSTHEAPNKH